MEEVKIVGVIDGNLNVSLAGDIDSGNADAFYRVVMDAYHNTPANLTFACEKLEFIDSTTLGTFVKILKAVKTDGYKMTLKGLQSKIKKLFLICSLDTVMEIA